MQQLRRCAFVQRNSTHENKKGEKEKKGWYTMKTKRHRTAQMKKADGEK